MNLIGRKREIDMLDTCLRSGRPEFVAVYGRRRVGKTYLVREYFKNTFAFYATGVARGKMRDQLRSFAESLQVYGSTDKTVPRDWFDAFGRLRQLLQSKDVVRDRASGRIVVFLDELPWFDTARSDFKAALDLFWNGWASANPQMMLVVCGSATSWIVSNLFNDRGGFHNRVTRQINLQPFTLAECEAFYNANGIQFTRQQMIESYMVLGGIPYYLNLIDRRMSLAQNIDQLCFKEYGPLRYEFDRLFSSLFKKPEHHLAIIRALARKRCGLTRQDLEGMPGVTGGQPLTKALAELEQCGFIRKTGDFIKPKNGCFYQLIDPFTLFYLRFIQDDAMESWMLYTGTQGYYAWRGNAFEMVCMAHIDRIKDALGIAGVATSTRAWRSRSSDPGAQIDLVIDRADAVVDLCEMKFSDGEYSIDKAYDAALRNKREAFMRETNTKKAVHITMITANGLAHNKYWGTVQSEVTADDLFR